MAQDTEYGLAIRIMGRNRHFIVLNLCLLLRGFV